MTSNEPASSSGSASDAPGDGLEATVASPATLTFVLSGPGGVGKGTVARVLIDVVDNLWLSKSWTTRDPRPGETADAYHFVTRGEFIEHVESDGFVEWAEFLGNMYGTPVPAPPPGHDVLLEIDVQGARQVSERDGDAILIFLDAPSPEVQRERLVYRGDTDEKVQDRLTKAAEERDAGTELGAQIVINDVLDDTVVALAALIEQHRATRR